MTSSGRVPGLLAGCLDALVPALAAAAGLGPVLVNPAAAHTLV